MKKVEIILANKKINVYITYKNMKSIRIRIKEGNIFVSSPIGTTFKQIENLMIKYQTRIISQLDQYQSYYDYQDGGYVYLFDQKYIIVLRDIGKRICQIHGNLLYVYHRDIQNCVENFLKENLFIYLNKTIKDYLSCFFELPMPSMKIKKYKGRWGSCYYEKGLVTFNLSLVFLKKDLIDYVIMHELVHFLQPNHSSSFYKEIERRMPDYKRRIKELKEKHI